MCCASICWGKTQQWFLWYNQVDLLLTLGHSLALQEDLSCPVPSQSSVCDSLIVEESWKKRRKATWLGRRTYLRAFVDDVCCRASASHPVQPRIIVLVPVGAVVVSTLQRDRAHCSIPALSHSSASLSFVSSSWSPQRPLVIISPGESWVKYKTADTGLLFLLVVKVFAAFAVAAFVLSVTGELAGFVVKAVGLARKIQICVQTSVLCSFWCHKPAGIEPSPGQSWRSAHTRWTGKQKLFALNMCFFHSSRNSSSIISLFDVTGFFNSGRCFILRSSW